MRKKTLELMRYIAEDLNESYISGYSHIFAYDFIPYNRVKYIKQLLKRAGVIVPVTGWKWLEDKAAEWKVTKLFPEWYDKLKEVPYVNLYEEWKKEPLPPSDRPLASEVRLSSKYHKRVSIKSIEWAEEQLSLSYPWLKEYQQKVEDINSRQPSLPKITFSPKITADGALLKKASIRWANCMTGKKKSERHQWLQKLGLTEEFDVKNSIYKVTHLMNTGVWLPQTVDLYKSIWEVTKQRPVEGVPDNVAAAWRGNNFTAEMRDIIKKCVMSAYFDSTEKLYLHHLKVSNKVSEWMKPFVQGLWTDMRAVVGQTYDNEVFFHESCIYIDVVDKLTQMGVTVWNCFDGFYFNRSVNVEQMVAEAAVNYYQKVQKQSVSLNYYYRHEKDNSFCLSVYIRERHRLVRGVSAPEAPGGSRRPMAVSSHTSLSHTSSSSIYTDRQIRYGDDIDNNNKVKLDTLLSGQYRLRPFSMATLDEYSYHMNRYVDNRQLKGLKHDSTNMKGLKHDSTNMIGLKHDSTNMHGKRNRTDYEDFFKEHPECSTTDRSTFVAAIAKYGLNKSKVSRLWKWLNEHTK